MILSDSNLELPKTYVILDIETTGLDLYNSEIIRISMLRILNNKIIDSFDQYCKNSIPLPILIKKITGITDEMLKEMPYAIEVFNEMYSFIDNDLVLIHNAEFDIGMISSEYERNGFEKHEVPTIKFLDTLYLVRQILPKELVISYSLENLMFVMGLDLKPHDSIEDCKIIFHLIQYMKVRLENK